MFVAIIMIDGSVKRKPQLGLELQISRVIEKHSNKISNTCEKLTLYHI